MDTQDFQGSSQAPLTTIHPPFGRDLSLSPPPAADYQYLLRFPPPPVSSLQQDGNRDSSPFNPGRLQPHASTLPFPNVRSLLTPPPSNCPTFGAESAQGFGLTSSGMRNLHTIDPPTKSSLQGAGPSLPSLQSILHGPGFPTTTKTPCIPASNVPSYSPGSSTSFSATAGSESRNGPSGQLTRFGAPFSSNLSMNIPDSKDEQYKGIIDPSFLQNYHQTQPFLSDTVRPFACHQCPQTFKRNHDLKRHMRIHFASKPFPCDHCEKSFTREDALKRHVLVKACGKGEPSRMENPHLTHDDAIMGNKSASLSIADLDCFGHGDVDPAWLVASTRSAESSDSGYGSIYEFSAIRISPTLRSSEIARQVAPLLESDQGLEMATAVPPIFYPTPEPSSAASSLPRSTSVQSRSGTADALSRGLCPIATCGRYVKDLKAHMLTHQSERPEKCPITICEYHLKGFARRYDKTRHTLTHFKGTMVCGFCPGVGSAAEMSFNRADVFKRHLTSVHGVEQVPPNARRKSLANKMPYGSDSAREASSTCSTCGNAFTYAQDFYEHLDDCVLRVVQQADPSDTIEHFAPDGRRTSSSALNTQPRLCSKERPATCSVCSNTFDSAQALDEHHDASEFCAANGILAISENEDGDVQNGQPLERTSRNDRVIYASEDVWAMDTASSITVASPTLCTSPRLELAPLATSEGLGFVAVQHEKPDSSMDLETPLPSHSSDVIAMQTSESRTVQEQMLQELRNIISDLQARTESLLRQTKPKSQASAEVRSRNTSQQNRGRSHSTPPPFARVRGENSVLQGPDVSESPTLDCTPETLDDEMLPSPTPSQSVYSDAGAPYNRSRRSISPGSSARARSEPPGRPRIDYRGKTHNHNKKTAPAEPSDGHRSHTYQSNVGRPSKKRKAPHDARGPSDDRGHNNRPSGPKRCKIVGRGDESSDKERLPCIFHAGEPMLYSSDDKRYEYISQLLRHLRRHDFYACPKCYTKFKDGEAQDLHAQEDPCRKSCRNRRCTRHLPSGVVRESGCECILSPEQQWRQLFRLQYPDLPLPNLVLFSSYDTTQEVLAPTDGLTLDGVWDDLTMDFNLSTSNQYGTNDATFDQTVHNSIERMDVSANATLSNSLLAQTVNENIDPHQTPLQLPRSNDISADETQNAPSQTSTSIQVDETFFTEVQTLRQRVQLLEQRLSQPSDREQDLEMVLGNVWQALVRSRSADAQPESPVWRLVRRFAGSILSTVPRSFTESQPTAAPTGPSSFQWQDLLGSCLPSGTTGPPAGADSGYGSLP